jgi:hypothetical protein
MPQPSLDAGKHRLGAALIVLDKHIDLRPRLYGSQELITYYRIFLSGGICLLDCVFSAHPYLDQATEVKCRHFVKLGRRPSECPQGDQSIVRTPNEQQKTSNPITGMCALFFTINRATRSTNIDRLMHYLSMNTIEYIG